MSPTGVPRAVAMVQNLALQLPKIEFLDYSVQIGANENGMKPKTIRKWKYRQCENCLLNVSKNAFKPLLLKNLEMRS